MYGVSVTLLQYLNKCLNINLVKINTNLKWNTRLNYMIPGNEFINFFLFKSFRVGPYISLPIGVVLFLNKILLLYLNLT